MASERERVVMLERFILLTGNMFEAAERKAWEQLESQIEERDTVYRWLRDNIAMGDWAAITPIP